MKYRYHYRPEWQYGEYSHDGQGWKQWQEGAVLRGVLLLLWFDYAVETEQGNIFDLPKSQLYDRMEIEL